MAGMTTSTPALRRRLAVLAASLATALGGVVAVAGPAAAAPAALTAPATGKSGGLVVLAGTSWPAYASVNVFLVRNGSSSFMCTVHADSGGTVASQTCAVPTFLVAGTYTTHADDSQGHTADAASTLALKAALTPMSTNNNQPTPTVAAGSTLSLTGHGFAGLSAVTVKLGATTVATTPAAPATDANGTFSNVVFTVPAAQPAGAVTVRATDAATNTATYQVTVFRAAVTSRPSGAANELTTLSGAGWPAGHTVNAYVVDGPTSAFMCGLHADNAGALATQSCTVPSFLKANADLLVLTDGFVTVSQPFTVTPSIAPTSTFNNQPTTNAAAGSTIGLAGHGFALNSPLVVKLGTRTLVTVPAAPTTDGNGGFSGLIATIPVTQPAALATLKVTDGAANARTFKLSMLRAAVTAPAAGPAGVSQLLSGSGWSPGSSVNAYLAAGASNNFMCTLHADDSGNLAPQSCTVPNFVPAGADSIVLSDGWITAAKAFTVQSAIAVTNGSGQPLAGATVGTAVTLAGFGFTANSTVSAKLGTKTLNLVPSIPATNANGGFGGVTFAVPNITVGTYTLTVTDGAGKKGSAQFTVH
jgi:hypothetical protein